MDTSLVVIDSLKDYTVPLSVVSLVVLFLISKLKIDKKAVPAKPKKAKVGIYGSGDYEPPKIVPVGDDFVWDKAPFLKPYPFKDAEYKMTMAVKKLDPNEWLLIEPSYLRNIKEKTLLTSNKSEKYKEFGDVESRTIFSTPECEPAIRELYETVVDFLLHRYPQYFKLDGNTVHNLITGDDLPAKCDETVNVKEYLKLLVRNVEEDFVLLLKDPQHQKEEDEYYFKGGVFAFAGGFDPADKFNKPMTAIHEPLPGYKEKLRTSMNRFFNRVTPGQFVCRLNFSVQTHDKFFVHDRNKGHNRPKDFVVVPKKEEELDFDNQVHYRSERQTLSRLPKTGAIVFTLRTYLIPMSQVRNEGKEVAERLAGAIDKLPVDIKTYKNGYEWGDAVASYLRKHGFD